ncbi:MAG: hypothetical protein KGJ57_18610 [Sphingomonadales bacterium]|nr:hypothetical protein [Sphingomonadales bacterium]MDE2171410.1 hypothetical protein [Sphingomonadales bacterium]
MFDHKDQAGLAQAVLNCLALFKLDPARDEEAPAHVLALINAAEAEPKIITLLDQLLPREMDAPRWLNWLQGGPAPTVPHLERPVDDSTKSPSGGYLAQLKKVERAEQLVDTLKARLAEAEQGAATARSELKDFDTNLRAAVFFAVFDRMQKIIERAAALGPAFTLARITSGYLQADVGFEATLSDEQRAALHKHRAERGFKTTQLADILDRHCGEQQFEVSVFNALYKAVIDGDEAVRDELKLRAVDHRPLSKLARRPRRRSEAQRSSVHPDAQLHDAADVLNGLAEVFDHD